MDALCVDGVLGADANNITELIDNEVVGIEAERLAVTFGGFVFSLTVTDEPCAERIGDAVATALTRFRLDLDNGPFVLAHQRGDIQILTFSYNE